MPEIIHAYDGQGNIIRTDERKKLLKEQQEESIRLSKPTFSVAAVFGLYKNSNNQLYVQLRGDKDENPFLLDKTIGGHIVAGQTPDQSIIKETQEELGALVQIVSPEDYSSALKKYDTQKTAIIRKLDYIPNLESSRKNRDGSSWLKIWNITLYGGTYNGPVKFVDGEAEGMHLLPIDDVLSMIRDNPEKFTYDLGYLIMKYKDNI
jgi:8-oxo-dGTP pyrophosphatase MutT (NUDIX family)